MAASEQNGLSIEEQMRLRAELEHMSTADLIERVKADALVSVKKDRRHFDRATATRVECFSRLRLPKGSDTIGKRGS